jgi:hypothetical protein
MKDRRVVAIRSALEGLVESLGAVVRIAGWDEPEAPPEPIQGAAASLLVRLGSANRLASGRFTGTPADVARVGAMTSAITRLDGAYVAYRRRLEAEGNGNAAARDLDAALDEVRASSASWADTGKPS